MAHFTGRRVRGNVSVKIAMAMRTMSAGCFDQVHMFEKKVLSHVRENRMAGLAVRDDVLLSNLIFGMALKALILPRGVERGKILAVVILVFPSVRVRKA